MRSVLLIALLALVALTYALQAKKGADKIGAFKDCISTCRASKNSFRFCAAFCKPEHKKKGASKKSSTGSKKTTGAKKQHKAAIERKPQQDAESARVLQDILGDDYAPSSDATQAALNTDSKGLWDKYRTVLKDFFRQGNQDALPGLQLVPNPFPADWDIQPEILTNLCNRIPKYGPVYEPSQNEFTSQYGDWILNLKVAQVSSVPAGAFDAIDERLKLGERKINDAEMDCMDRYDMRYGNRRSLSGPPPTYDEYVLRFCPSIDRANKEYDMAMADYEIQQRQTYGEHFALARAIAKYSQTSRSGNFKWVTLGSMARFVESAKENRTNAFEIKITSKTTVTTEKMTSMNVGVGFGYGDFVKVSANYESSKFTFNTNTDELQLIVGAAGYKIFPVYPDRSWFSPELFLKYKNYPLRTPKNYFGKDGAMPLMPKMFVVVVGPRLTMLVSKEDASKVEKMSGFGVKLTVGGFDFDFAKKASMKKSQESANLFKITIEGNSYEPQVLAVDNEILAN